MIPASASPGVPFPTTPSSPPARLGLRAFALTATAAAILGAAAMPASAAPGPTASDTTRANVVVQSAIALSVDTAAFTLTGVPGTTVGPEDVEMTVETNNLAGYAVTVLSDSATLDPAASTNPDTIPIANLHVREAGSTGFTPLSVVVPVTVGGSDTRSADVNGDVITNEFEVDIPFVNADTYSTTLTYTATTL